MMILITAQKSHGLGSVGEFEAHNRSEEMAGCFNVFALEIYVRHASGELGQSLGRALPSWLEISYLNA